MSGIGQPYILTPEFDAGPASYEDKYDSAKINNGARNPLGACAVYTDAKGRNVKFRFVRVNSTTPPTLAVGPVFWKDNTFQVVTAVGGEGFNSPNVVAGVILNTGLTNGDFTWILTAGYCGAGSDAGYGAAIAAPALTAIGDAVIGSVTGNQGSARVAAGTAPTGQVFYWALTAVSGGKSDGLVAADYLA